MWVPALVRACPSLQASNCGHDSHALCPAASFFHGCLYIVKGWDFWRDGGRGVGPRLRSLIPAPPAARRALSEPGPAPAPEPWQPCLQPPSPAPLPAPAAGPRPPRYRRHGHGERGRAAGGSCWALKPRGWLRGVEEGQCRKPGEGFGAWRVGDDAKKRKKKKKSVEGCYAICCAIFR